MKRVSQMTALAMALGLACASSPVIELALSHSDQLQQQKWQKDRYRLSAF